MTAAQNSPSGQVPLGYKQTEVGVIPEDWDPTSIAQFGEVITGGTPPTNEKENWNGHYPWITPTDIGEVRDITSGERSITAKGLKLIRTLPPNSVLVTCIASIGKNAILLNVGSCNQQINAIIPRQEIDAKFLYYEIEENTSRLIGIAGITATQIVSKAQFKEFLLPLPPTKAEQEAISEALSDADALIESLEQLIAKKRQIKQGAMQELLTPPQGSGQAGKERLPGFSGEWEVKTLGESCELITKGTTPTSIGRNFTTDGISFLKAESISPAGRPLVDKTAFIDKETHTILKRSQLYENDILISIAGVLGRVGIVTFEVIPANTNQALAIVRLGKNSAWNHTFLFYSLRSPAIMKQIMDVNVAAAQANISLQNVHDLQINIPASLEEQNAIATILSDMDAEIAALESKLAKARQVKQGMMQELLTGRTRLV